MSTPSQHIQRMHLAVVERTTMTELASTPAELAHHAVGAYRILAVGPAVVPGPGQRSMYLSSRRDRDPSLVDVVGDVIAVDDMGEEIVWTPRADGDDSYALCEPASPPDGDHLHERWRRIVRVGGAPPGLHAPKGQAWVLLSTHRRNDPAIVGEVIPVDFIGREIIFHHGRTAGGDAVTSGRADTAAEKRSYSRRRSEA